MKRLLFLVIWILVILNFTYGWAVWHILSGGKRFSEKTSSIVINFAKLPSDFFHELNKFIDYKYLPTLVPNLNSTHNGINWTFKNTGELDYVLLSTVNPQNKLAEFQLFDLKQNKPVKTWQPKLENIDYSVVSKSNTRLLHPIIFKKDIICNVNSRILRINGVSNNIIWRSSNLFHHSIEIDANKTIWACGSFEDKDSKKVIKDFFTNDGIFNLDPETGKILFAKSVYEALIENGYTNLFYSSGIVEKDPIHINDIQPALKDGKFWKKGDLLISLRHKSTVFLYRPSTNKILWLKTGPWLNQHDCDFLNDHQIGVFGNDVVRVFQKNILIRQHNNQYIYDFNTDKVSTPYTKMFREAKIGTLTEGRSRILPNGDLYVEETNHGRILFGNTQGLYATFVSRIDKEHIAMLGWSRYYTKEELLEATKTK